MRQNLMPSIVLSDRTLSRSTDSAFELLVVEVIMEVMAVWFRFAENDPEGVAFAYDVEGASDDDEMPPDLKRE